MNGARKLTLLLFASLALGAGLFSYKLQLQRLEKQSLAGKGDINAPYKAYPGGDFTMNSFAGEVSLADFKGTPVLLYFGYTYCPDVCPNSLTVMAAAMKILAAEGAEQGQAAEQKAGQGQAAEQGQGAVQGLLISLDPERDTLAKLKDYAPYFHPDILGLNSSPHRLLEVATRYGVYYKKNTGSAAGKTIGDEAGDGEAATGDYLIDHTSRIYLIGRDSKLAAVINHGASATEIAERVRRLDGNG